MKVIKKSTLCRICLAKDVRMCDLVNTYLQETYESLTAMQFETKDSRPSQVCYICYAQLQTCHKLRSKSLHSEELFCQVLDSSELNLAPLQNDVTPLLTIRLVTHLSIVPASSDATDTVVKHEENDEPSLGCSNIIDNVQVKTEHVEGIEDVFDANEVKIVYDNDENNVSETEDTILPLSAINKSESSTPVASRYDVCLKTVEIVLERLELTNIGTSVPAPMELSFTEQENKAISIEDVNDSKEEYINKTGYLSPHIPHTDIDRPYKCDICGKCFKRKKNLSRHTRLHTDVKAYGCEVCGKAFKRKDNLSCHMLTHTDIRAYSCDVCGKGFKGKDQLSFHIRTHTGIRAYACDICGKGFTSSMYLKRHHSRTHTHLKVYACDICGKDFKRKEYLSSHMLTHTGIKAYACDICGKYFNRKYSLESHIVTHTDIKAYACDICGKGFTSNLYLKKHLSRTHTHIKEYACDICGKVFKGKDYLACLSSHMLTHTGIRAYACDVCGKGFRIRKYLKNHMRRHT